MEVALFEPRIPQNTGNIARSCAAFNIPLNLIEPLGFKLEDKYLKRAGLDYWPLVTVNQYENFEKFLASKSCLLYTSPSPRDSFRSRMPSSA